MSWHFHDLHLCLFAFFCVKSHVDLLPAGGCVPLDGRRRVPLGADRAFDRGRGGGGRGMRRRMTRLGRASLFFFLLLLLRGKVHLQHRRGILRRARESDILLLLLLLLLLLRLLLLLLLFLRLVSSSSPLASRRVELHHVPVEVPTAQRALDRRLLLLLLLELLLVEAAAPRAARVRVGRGGDAGGGRPRGRSRGPLKKRKGMCYKLCENN